MELFAQVCMYALETTQTRVIAAQVRTDLAEIIQLILERLKF